VGAAASFGGYSAGCVRGARALPMDGPGFQLARPSRGKIYGHPQLVDFVKDLGAAVKKRRHGVLFIADLGQPRGGPAPNGHSSHQSGLDADIWYWHPRRAVRKVMPVDKRERLTAPRVVSFKREKKTRYFNRAVRGKLELAAKDPRVARIFVNPVVKKVLCESVPKRRRGWLRKLRPWWGHDRHFHVRLECPADSPGCEKQEPIKAGDGCDEIDWWLDEKAQAERREQRASYRKRVRELPQMPEACRSILE
jgi:penicillin-insensitive murein endopeptidase